MGQHTRDHHRHFALLFRIVDSHGQGQLKACQPKTLSTAEMRMFRSCTAERLTTASNG